MERDSRDEVLQLFPELSTLAPKGFERTARVCLNKADADALRAFGGFN